MVPVSASAVSSLRTRTGVSILACKEALEEASGNEEEAIGILRKRGMLEAAKRAARDQNEGQVFLKEAKGTAALVLLRCETDFVARDAALQSAGRGIVSVLLAEGQPAAEQLAQQAIPDLVNRLGENISLAEMHRISSPVLGSYVHSNAKIGVIIGLEGGTVAQARDAAMHAAAMNPLYVAAEDVSIEVVEKEKDIWREQLMREGKPATIVGKIMIGKERKFRAENALLTQPFVKDPDKTVGQYLAPAKVTAYVRVSVA